MSKIFKIPEKKKLYSFVEKEIHKQMKKFIGKLPQTLTPKDIENILSFGKTKIYMMLNTGEIPAHKVSGKWIIPKIVFLKWYFTGEEIKITKEEIKKAI